MNKFSANRAKLVEIQITQTGAGGTLQFPVNLDDLNNAEITAIQIITTTQLALAPSGRPCITAAMQAFLGVTLAAMPGSDKKIDTVPIYSTNRELNAGEFYTFKPFVWNPSSSKLNILSAGLATTDSVCIVFYYNPL